MKTPYWILIWAILLLGYTLGANQIANKVPDRIAIKLIEWESLIARAGEIDTTVSQVPVAWHLDHGLKVINEISVALQKSDPNQFKRGLSLTRLAVYLWGAMPRGVGKAPKSVRPPQDIQKEDILAQLAEARENIQRVQALPLNAHFDHPVFGTLNRNQVIRFFEIHTEHHLKIIRDILD